MAALTPEQIAQLVQGGWLKPDTGAAMNNTVTIPTQSAAPMQKNADALANAGITDALPGINTPIVPAPAGPVSNAHATPTNVAASLTPQNNAAVQQAQALLTAGNEPSGVPGPSTASPQPKSADLARPTAEPGSLTGQTTPPAGASTPSNVNTLSEITIKGSPGGASAGPAKLSESKPPTAAEEQLSFLRSAQGSALARAVAVNDAVAAKADAEAAKATAQSTGMLEAAQQAQTRMDAEKNQMLRAQQEADAADADSKKRAIALGERKIDPNRMFHDASVVGKIGIILAQSLGAMGSALAKTPNFAMQMIQAQIDRDVAAQRDDIMNAKDSAKMLDDLSKRKYGRAMNQNEFDAHQRMDAYNYAIHQTDAIAKSYDSPIAQANGDLLKQQLGAEGDQQRASIAQNIYQVRSAEEAKAEALRRAQAAAGAQSEKERKEKDKEVRTLAAKISEDRNIPIDQATMAAAALIHGVPAEKLGLPKDYALPRKEAPMSSKQKGELSEGEQEQLRSRQQGLSYLYDLRDMIKEGGEWSPERTAKGQSLYNGAVNSMARAETGGHRAPSETEQKLIEKQLGDKDPNAWHAGRGLGLSNPALAGINETIKKQEEAVRALGGSSRTDDAKKDQDGVKFKPEGK